MKHQISNKNIREWKEENLRDQISKIKEDMRIYSKEINDVDQDVVNLLNKKKLFQRKYKNKQIYLNQLSDDLANIINKKHLQSFNVKNIL